MGIFDNYRTLQLVLNAGNEASNRDVILDSGKFHFHSATGITDLDGAKIAGKTDLQDDVEFSPAGVAGHYGINLANMYFEGVRFGVPDAIRANNYIQFLTTKTLICAYNGTNLGVLEIDALLDRYRFRYLDEILIEDATKITTPVGLLFDGIDIREIPNDYAGLGDYNAHIGNNNAHHNESHPHAHADTTGKTTDDHHNEAHSLASHSSEAHSELTGVTASQHHAKYTDAEAVDAIEAVPLVLSEPLEISDDPAVFTLKDKSTSRAMSITMGTSTSDPVKFETNNAWAFYVDGTKQFEVTDVGVVVCHGPVAMFNNLTMSAGKTVDGVDVSAEPARISTEIDTDIATAIALLEAQLAIGSDNALWINCPYEGGDVTTEDEMDANGTVQPQATGRLLYSVPLPRYRNGLYLHINGTRVSLSDADASNYVNTTYIYGMANTTMTYLDTDPTNKNSVTIWTDTSMDVNTFGYHVLKIALATIIGTPNNLNIQSVQVRYYYA